MSQRMIQRTTTAAAQPAINDARREPSRVEVENHLELLSRLMDSQFAIPGTNFRFGLDSLLGLIPGLGDSSTAIVSFYILAAAVRYRVPKVTLLRMGFNIGLDYTLGNIPVVGDLFDAYWKANTRNIELIRRRASVSATDARKGKLSDYLIVGVIIIALIAILIASVSAVWLVLAWLWNQLRGV